MDKKEIESLKRLDAMLKRFEELDTSLFEDWGGRTWGEMVAEVLDAKRDIKKYLADRESVRVSGDLSVKLKKIRDNYGYNIDQVCELVTYKTRKIINQDEDDVDLMDMLYNEGREYVNEGFFKRRIQVGSVITTHSWPDILLHHFGKMKECFALGLFEATLIYCRAIIEFGVFEKLKSTGKIKSDKKVRDFAEYSLMGLMNLIKPSVYRNNYDEARKVIGKANDILHRKHEDIIVTEQQAFDSIKSVFAMIEELYK